MLLDDAKKNPMKHDLNDTTPADMTRRNFVKLAVATGVALGAGPVWAEEFSNDMIYRTLGRTGERVSALGVGGYHIGNPAEAEGIRIIRTAMDHGVNFMDNCWDYHDGDSEVRMGMALRDGYRKRAFLMTKIDGHTKAAAASQINESLKRLQTDHVDLMQFHEVVRPGDPEKIFAPGGSAEAMLEAKKAGKVRYIGFTGHKDPAIHLKMLKLVKEHDFPLDAVQMPLNVMDAHFRSFAHQVVPELVANGIGVLGMKPLGSGAILRSNTVTPTECLHYALNLPTSVVITGMDTMAILEQGLAAVRTFKPMSPQEVATLLAKTAAAAANGDYERFKTSTAFDGTAQNPQWLG
jgi:aryl-alcohol dehydrogenase-like predicted oxidoreductase